jgi:hypothetical protein
MHREAGAVNVELPVIAAFALANDAFQNNFSLQKQKRFSLVFN